MEESKIPESKLGDEPTHKHTESKSRDLGEGKAADLSSKRKQVEDSDSSSDEGFAIEQAEPTIIKRAMQYCFSKDFIGIFEDYIQKYACVFYDAVDDEEHKLEYTDCFNQYLKVFEGTMEDWLTDESISLKEFFQMCQKAKEEGDVVDKYFMKLLMASAEYDCFYEVMVKEARKQVDAKSHA